MALRPLTVREHISECGSSCSQTGGPPSSTSCVPWRLCVSDRRALGRLAGGPTKPGVVVRQTTFGRLTSFFVLFGVIRRGVLFLPRGANQRVQPVLPFLDPSCVVPFCGGHALVPDRSTANVARSR